MSDERDPSACCCCFCTSGGACDVCGECEYGDGGRFPKRRDQTFAGKIVLAEASIAITDDPADSRANRLTGARK